MRINPIVYGFIVLAVFLGTILGFQAAGVWSTSGKVTSEGEAVQPSAMDVNTIKGWMTLEQITTTYHIPLADLLKQFDLPGDTSPTTAIKDLESDLFSVTSLREWLLSRMDAAAGNPTENNPAAPLLAATPTAQPASAETTVPTPTEHVVPANTITGKTTFKQLLDWGVSKEAVQKVIGGELPPTSSIIKDFVTGKGLEFPSVKTALQAEVDKVK